MKIHFKCALIIIIVNLFFFNCFSQTTNKDRIVVLTFDDASKSHYSVVAPMLKKYGFNATFYVCEFPPDFADTTKYMTWKQIQVLYNKGFDIGNHTWHHAIIKDLDEKQLEEEIAYIEHKCDSLHIAKPESFAYPSYITSPIAVATLKKMGYQMARVGGDTVYNPVKDNPYFIPSFNMAGDNRTHVYDALSKAGNGDIVVFTIHGVPDNAHSFVSTPPEVLEEYLKYMKANHFKVISMKALEDMNKANSIGRQR